MMIFRIMAGLFAVALLGTFFLGYSNNATLTNIYPNTTGNITYTFSAFSNQTQNLQASGTSNFINDILNFVTFDLYDKVTRIMFGIPTSMQVFISETLSIIGISNDFINLLANLLVLGGSLYVILWMIEILRPGSTGVKML